MSPKIKKCFILTALVLGFRIIGAQGQTPDGVIDLRNATLDESPSTLNGVWEFFPNTLISPQSKLSASEFRAFPGLWFPKEQIDYGTYRARAVLPHSSAGKAMAIQVPHFFSSYALYLNGELIGTNGHVSTSADDATPEWRPALYHFTPLSDTINVVLHVSNFFHVHGGTRKSLLIAEADVLNAQDELVMMTDYILLGTLLLIAIVSLLWVYVMRSNRSPFLYLPLFTLSWALHSACSNHYRIQDWVDISWSWLVKLEHLTIFFTIVTALLFMASLFPGDFKSKFLKLAFLVLAGAFSLFALFTKPILFTSWLMAYMVVAALLIIYVIIIISKSFVYERAGSTMMLITILLGAMTFGYVVLSYLGLVEINMLIYNFSFIILYSLLTVSMIVRVTRMKDNDETDVLTFEQMYR